MEIVCRSCRYVPAHVAIAAAAPMLSRRFAARLSAPKAAALGTVSWVKGLMWLMPPCYQMGRCERSRLMIMPV